MTRKGVDRAHREALKALIEARRRMLAATKAKYPVGSRVRVRLGRAEIYGIVLGHGFEWSDPRKVTIRNEKTGKVRRFNSGGDFNEVVEEP